MRQIADDCLDLVLGHLHSELLQLVGCRVNPQRKLLRVVSRLHLHAYCSHLPEGDATRSSLPFDSTVPAPSKVAFSTISNATTLHAVISDLLLTVLDAVVPRRASLTKLSAPTLMASSTGTLTTASHPCVLVYVQCTLHQLLQSAFSPQLHIEISGAVLDACCCCCCCCRAAAITVPIELMI